ncbi:MAG: OmpA family protein [Cyanobacteria bacterium J06634_5]
MVYLTFKQQRRKLLAMGGILSAILLLSAGAKTSLAEAINNSDSGSGSGSIQVTINSSADGRILADDALTLREAIELVNGTLPLEALSPVEQQFVTTGQSASSIHFDLPDGNTTIELLSVLPAIAQPGVTIDGTTQSGYDASTSATAEIEIPIPVVTIRPADAIEVFRGLTVAADEITIRGLNLYGFTARSRITRSTPPADIFITHRPASLNRETALPLGGGRTAAGNNQFSDQPPKGVVIEQNWLGLTVDSELPAVPSSFGVSVFDSAGTTIRRNRIEYHNGSAIITGRQADNLQVLENIIVGNGLSGMPDAIRLDGQVNNSLISSNLICGNDGSGVFLFKPDGAVNITDNDIRFNGQRLRRAAVYIMGDDHRVTDNTITHQKGSGVVVTAFGQGPNTQSTRNVITGNRFESVEGLSIDLNARRDREPQNFQTGDGPNPHRNSYNRRQDTGNSAVNAPQFISAEFFIINGQAIARGKADPYNEIQLYRSTGLASEYGPLSEPLATVTANEKGEFEFVLDEAMNEVRLSAIATDRRYGTSEPALNTTISALSSSGIGQVPLTPTPSSSAAHCTTPPLPPSSPSPPRPLIPSPPAEPTPIRLEVPRNIHFALDQDAISAESAKVLDQIIAVLNDYPSIVVDLHGHTDSRASVAYNQDLARRRAENARRYLLENGIGSERMTLRAFGETQLLVNESNRTNFARNRRVEFVFIDIRGANINVVDQENDLQIEP